MINNAYERVRLLKMGIPQKRIEELYIEENELNIVNSPVIFELVEIEEVNDEKKSLTYDAIEYAQTLCMELANLCDIPNISEVISRNRLGKTI